MRGGNIIRREKQRRSFGSALDDRLVHVKWSFGDCKSNQTCDSKIDASGVKSGEME